MDKNMTNLLIYLNSTNLVPRAHLSFGQRQDTIVVAGSFTMLLLKPDELELVEVLRYLGVIFSHRM